MVDNAEVFVSRPEEDGPLPDAEDRASWSPWRHYVRLDRRPAPEFLLESNPLPSEAIIRELDTAQFHEQAFHELEKRRFWSRVWQIAARENDIPQPGDYIEYTIANRSMLIVRDTDGSIKAFANACRHRGAIVASGSGSARCFTCPYHAWTYGLDGRLQKIPARWGFPQLDGADLALQPFRVETFDGWIFVNLDPEAAPLARFLGEELIRDLTAYPHAQFWKSRHLAAVLPFNWKLGVHSFLESYHVGVSHPAARVFVGDLQNEHDFYGPHSRTGSPNGVSSVMPGEDFSQEEIYEAFVAYIRGKFCDPDMDVSAADMPLHVEGRRAREEIVDLVRAKAAEAGQNLDPYCDSVLVDGISYMIFPNIQLPITPSGNRVFRIQPNGDDPKTCIFEVMTLQPPPAGQALPRDAAVEWMKPGETFRDYADTLGLAAKTMDEDLDLTVLLQRGVETGLSTIYLGEDLESRIMAFQHYLSRYLED